MPNNLQSIQFLRALAAMLVVFGHILSRLQYQYTSNAFMDYYDHIYSSGVDIFFVISGFIMVYITKDLPYSRTQAITFVKKRYIRIFPIYWLAILALISLLLIKLYLASSNSQVEEVTSKFFNITYVVKSIFLIPVFDVNMNAFPLLQVGWTLIFEIFFYSIFFIALLIFGRVKQRLCFLFILLTSVVCYQQLFVESKTAVLVFYGNPLLMEFLIGAVIGYLAREGKLIHKYIALILLVIGVILLISSGFYSDNYQGDHLSSIRVLKWGIPAALILYGLITLEEKIKYNKQLLLIGDASYSLYLFHTAAILPILGELFFIFNWYSMGIVVTSIIFFTTCIFVSIYIHRFVEMPLTNFLNKKYAIPKILGKK